MSRESIYDERIELLMSQIILALQRARHSRGGVLRDQLKNSGAMRIRCSVRQVNVPDEAALLLHDLAKEIRKAAFGTRAPAITITTTNADGLEDHRKDPAVKKLYRVELTVRLFVSAESHDLAVEHARDNVHWAHSELAAARCCVEEARDLSRRGRRQCALERQLRGWGCEDMRTRFGGLEEGIGGVVLTGGLEVSGYGERVLMTLTAEQLEARTRFIGASEFGDLAGVEEHMTPIDVFVKKRRGAALELPPLLARDDAGPAAEAGNFLEDGIAALYTHRTGIQVVKSGTIVHPDEPWAAATPDRLAVVDPHGVEIKLVGMRMAHQWDDDTIPPKVVIQCQIGMACAGRPYWDLAALVGGTDLRIRRIALRRRSSSGPVRSWTRLLGSLRTGGPAAVPAVDAEEARCVRRTSVSRRHGRRLRSSGGSGGHDRDDARGGGATERREGARRSHQGSALRDHRRGARDARSVGSRNVAHRFRCRVVEGRRRRGMRGRCSG